MLYRTCIVEAKPQLAVALEGLLNAAAEDGWEPVNILELTQRSPGSLLVVLRKAE